MNTVTQTKNKASVEATREERTHLHPPVNIFETKDGYVLEAEMPGVGKDGLEILLEANQLSIIGRRTDPVPKGVEVLYRESRNFDFRRDFALDPVIDTSRIQARIEQGVLTLNLPKAEAVKPRRIEVEG